MFTPTELAFRISHYATKLWDIATDPAISRGETPADYTKILVPLYAEPSDGQTMLSGNVPAILKTQFDLLARMGVPADDTVARNSLQSSLSTLQRVAALADPAAGYVTHFSNLQEPLKQKLPEILAIAETLDLVKR